ncbi:hypothetical protein GGI07_001884 [Coemansia sp. Benny D115]|nr:hypothetical protein GGI07_001884 [Coemansia sp. Benny D115]
MSASAVDDSGVTLPKGFESLNAYAQKLAQAYHSYGYLARMHIVDFFVSKHWNSLPTEWQQYFDKADFPITSLIDMASKGTVASECPDSLQEYVEQMFALQFPREKQSDAGEQDMGDDERQQILRYFLEGMSPKKQAEVVELSRLINRVSMETGSQRIVDVGAGQGYLTRVLAYGSGSSGAELLALDHDWRQARGAEKYQERVLKRLGGPRARSEGYRWNDSLRTRIVHDVQAISMQKTTELESVSQKGLGGEGFVLCGLHACGDLSSAVLKTFAEGQARAVVLVPCCYNHISERPDTAGVLGEAQLNETGVGELPGFPLSNAFSNVVLGTNALKAACQAAPRWEHDTAGTVESFRRNYYRALLHYLMVARGGLPRDSAFPVVGKITNTDLDQSRRQVLEQIDASKEDTAEIDFAVYVFAALEKLQYKWRPSVTECMVCRRENRHGLVQMAAVWALRSMVGSLVESIVVVDRAVYLREHCGGGAVRAFALFDPVTSPRNVVLVAQRNKDGAA